MARFLGVVEFGTLYKDGIQMRRPSRPWAAGKRDKDDRIEDGDIESFGSLPSMDKWTIGDTSEYDTYTLKWIKIEDENKTLFICDRVILNDVSWDDLHAQGYVYGKKIKIDGVNYECRLLSGGWGYRNRKEKWGRDGGTLPNEYDRFIGNTDNIYGLPTPTAKDIEGFSYKKLGGDHDKLWNWWNCICWCKESFKDYDGSLVLKTVRGGGSGAIYIQSLTSNSRCSAGWRPVLEIANNVPYISDTDKNLGDKNESFSITYTVNDIDNDSLIIVEKLNGNILRTLNNAPKGENLTINITNEQLYNLPLNQENKISVEVNDGKGGISYRNFTFRRTNTPPIISSADKDLGVITAIGEKYTVKDIEGNIVSVVEKLDNTILRTFNVDPSKEYICNIDRDMWIRLKNGQHKYIIEATDFNNAKTIRTFTFTKKETKISFTLAKPFNTDIKATKILITPSWEITGATAKVEACNNAFDINPTWEDITKQVLINRHYNFANVTKTAEKWGINIRFTIDKDPAAVNDVCVKGFGGAFE